MDDKIKIFSVENADEYISKNAPFVKTELRHTYHAMPPVGWMNDPNGFSYAAEKYHLFFQFYPYASVWGPMHWGHYSSDDLIKWNWVKTAIAPDTFYDKDGCFSGSAIEKDGKHYLFYTAVCDGNQTQASAVSLDGKNYVKNGVVVSGDKLPKDCSKRDFRDPYVFERDGKFYMICGSMADDKDGQLLLFSSIDLNNWNFVGVVRKDDKPTSGIYECPCVFKSGDNDVILSSPQGYVTEDGKYQNVNSSIYSVGKLNLKSGKFAIEYEDEIDGGLDFYAPQVVGLRDGRVIMIAWMQMWNRTMPTAVDGWAGACTLPRDLCVKNGKLRQTPVKEIEKYRKNPVEYSDVEINKRTELDGVKGTKIELSVKISMGNADKAGIKLFESENNYAEIYYDKKGGKVVFDRSHAGVKIDCDKKEKDAYVRSVNIENSGDVISFRIFLDVSSCEVFINDGEKVMTSNVYTAERGEGVSFFSSGDGVNISSDGANVLNNGGAKIISLTKYDIIGG